MTSSPRKPIRLVIIGRPNVGKSTLFNRLFGRRRALVHDEPGVTRDRLEENVEWIIANQKYPIKLVDTGGLGGERWAAEIENQVNIALEEADVVVMLFDGQAGLLPLDRELITGFQKRGLHKKARLIGVVNKVDADSHEDRIHDFYKSGLDPILTISAEHGRGIDELQQLIIESAEEVNEETESATDTEPPTDADTDTDDEDVRRTPVGHRRKAERR